MPIQQSDRQRVMRGARLLDEYRPDWRSRIDLSTLDLSNPCLCILGQVYAEAAEAASDALTDPMDLLRRTPFAYGLDVLDAADRPSRYGFDVVGVSGHLQREYADLQAAWVELLTGKFG